MVQTAGSGNGQVGEQVTSSLVTLKICFNSQSLYTNIKSNDKDGILRLEQFVNDVKEICGLGPSKLCTIKWLDEEGDPCTISAQAELNECLRLHGNSKEAHIVLHVFAGVPARPGMPCPGEDADLYRRGARRWKVFYHVTNHKLAAKRFARSAKCEFCKDSIWGLGRQGLKCVQCKVSLHKKCYKYYKPHCANALAVTDGGRQNLPASPSLPNINEGNKNAAEPTEAPDQTQIDRLLDEGNRRLTEFEMISVIGRGSYAKVLLVEQKSTKNVYAMKVIKKEKIMEEEDIDWVQTEKHVFEIVSNHPFLVGMHSCFQTSSRLFFIIEFVNGGDLMYHMQKKRCLTEDHARFYIAEIFVALAFLHRRKIIYRDLKLDNVLLDSDGHIKLTDYGMCKELANSPDLMTTTFCGTPTYIAPEILRYEDYSFSVDWWALGVLLYELLAGRSPFESTATGNEEQSSEELLFQAILEKPVRIPRFLSVKSASILKGLLNKDPRERLGCAPDTGFSDIQNHQFFKQIDWPLLEERQVAPPYKPRIVSDRDFSFFDPMFTEENVCLTPDNPQVLDTIDQAEFDGFEYVNPFLMTNDEAV